MSYSSNIELDEFDEMAFGLSPAVSTTATTRRPGDAADPLQFLNSRDPPPLRIPPKTVPAPASSTKIPLDGLFSDEDDDLFPPFQGASIDKQKSTPAISLPPANVAGYAVPPNFPSQNTERQQSAAGTTPTTRPASESIFDRLLPRSLESSREPVKTSSSQGASLESPAGRPSGLFGQPTASTVDNSFSGAKQPVRSSLFRNLVTPPWEQQEPAPVAAASSISLTPTAIPVVDKAKTERQRRAMIFGGSSSLPPVASSATSLTYVTPLPDSNTVPALASESAGLVNRVLLETKEAEDEDHRRVSSHHDFIRQQTQQAVRLQQSQANEFLKQYLAENKKQLDSHLQRLRTGFPLMQAVPAGSGDSSDADLNPSSRAAVFTLEKKMELLERKLEDRDSQLTQYSALMLALEDQHREEMRDQRVRHEEIQQRSAQTHHEYVVSLLANHEAVRRQYEEALGSLRDSVSAKTSLDVVRGTVEQSAREFAVWRSELEQKHESVVKDKDMQLQLKEIQIKDLTSMLERQTEKSRAEREALQHRIQDDTARLLKRQNEVEEQAYIVNRERMELDAERKNFHNLQAKEMQRLEKRLEESLRERQSTLESLAEERSVVEEDRRKLSDTIRAAEEKYALDYKKKQLEVESAREAVTSERRLLEEKHRNLEREINSIKDERERLERDKSETATRKAYLDRYNSELHQRDLELEQTTLRVAKIKRDGELALHEAKFMDEEHKNRVAKFNVFLEQLRDKELNLMRQAVVDPDSDDTRQRTAIQLPSGALTILPRRASGGLVPNPARDVRYWQQERDYLQVMKNSQWTTKKTL